jgi:ABC-2 type transport system permease protein
VVAAVRVSWAFVLRDLRIEAAHLTGIAMRVLAPVTTVVIFLYLQRSLRGANFNAVNAAGYELFPFAVLGLAGLGYMSYGVGAMVNRIRESQAAGTLEHIVVSPTRLTTILLASSLPGFLLGTISVVTYLVAATAMGVDFSHANVGLALLSWLLATVAFIALALLAASVVIMTRRGNAVSFGVRTASFALSGVIYPVHVLPGALGVVAQVLPLTHALDLMRGSLLAGQGIGDLWGHLVALVAIIVMLFPLALVACHGAVRIARNDGSLTH